MSLLMERLMYQHQYSRARLIAETKNLTGSAGNDSLTLTGGQLNTILLSGSSIIDFAGGTDTLSLTTTSTDFNTRGLTNTAILNLENY